MSKSDQSDHSAIEELLQLSEQAEARALRAELASFVQSADCRDALESIVRKPLEEIVKDALGDQKLQAALQRLLVANLSGPVVDAARSATNEFASRISLSIDPAIEQRLVAKLQQAVETSVSNAQLSLAKKADTLITDACKALKQKIEVELRSALADPAALLPRDWTASITRLVQTAAGEALRTAQAEVARTADAPETKDWPAASHEEPSTRLPQSGGQFADRLRSALSGRLLVVIVVILGVVATTVYLFSPGRTAEAPGVTAPTPNVEPPAPAARLPRAPGITADAVRRNYRTALEHVAVGPAPSLEGWRCIDEALDRLRDGTPDVVTVRAALASCSSLSRAPTGASPFVAVVQRALGDETRRCSRIGALAIDGLDGRQTSVALQAYQACSSSNDVLLPLQTMADYVAVGVYLIARRGY